MLYVETDKITYNRIKTLFPDLRPDTKITLIACDDNLERLGFCDSAPCLVGFDLTFDELDVLLKELIFMEANAYNTSNGYDPTDYDPDYQLYVKYGWLYNILYYAKEYKEAE